LKTQFEKTKPIYAGLNGHNALYERRLRQYAGLRDRRKQSQTKPIFRSRAERKGGKKEKIARGSYRLAG
jgi:hypothetical protein